ncbi:unnamed protein product [Rotaria socialis]|uniref:BRCT domain-containing protein n=2 Tax=Rotaria socialis TaxID=392032 RepID=A0A817SU74_9BILA|nr:unnamed protein product [Rotaria socialis]CAF4451981.1 unnamed protein product [Rotaria socialis]
MTSGNKIDRAILFSQCQFFIDYRSSQNGCDRSLRLGNELEKKYGANIVEQPHASSTTHIIFKNGNLETKLYANKNNIPLVDPMWLEHCIKKRRLIKIDKYQVVNDENQQPAEELPFDQLVISNKDLIVPSTPKNKAEQLQDVNIDSGKKPKKVLYTPIRGQFDEGNPHEYFDHQNRVITLENLGINLPDSNHVLIHRYGCSVARRQVQENPRTQFESKDKQLTPMKLENLPTTSSIPSQSQSSPIIHFANNIRQISNAKMPITVSLSTTFDFDSQQQYAALGDLPQSTPLSSPILRPALRLNNLDNYESNEILIEKNLENPKEKQLITPLKTIDYTSFTKVTPLDEINDKTKSRITFELCHNEDDERDFVLPNVKQIIDELETSTNNDQIIPRPPPLLALSQNIRAKHPEQLINTKLDNQLPSIKDLPNAPANYSFVFYEFSSPQLEEAKRLTRRMGDCFSFETIDMTITHIILPDDNPQMTLTLNLLLALIYGCRLVTFEWLKSSSRIGEWLNVNKFEPKRFFQSNPSLNIYRKSRLQQKPICLFNKCGLIYLTSIAKQRSLLLKLISLLGGNITVNRNQAKIVVGYSSKPLQVIIYPQVNEQWVIDSIKSGECLSTDDYLIENNNNKCST